MRSLTAGLISSLSGSTDTFGLACLITRVDSTAQRFTNIQTTTTFDSNAFTAVPGIFIKSFPFQANQGSTRIDVELAGAFAADEVGHLEFFDTNDVRDGLYDEAQIVVYLCDHQNAASSLGVIFSGTIGEVNLTDRGKITFECNGLLSKSGTIIVEHRTPTCRNWLYDERCTINQASFSETGTVTASSGFSVTFTGVTAVTDYYNLGPFTILSGRSKGRVYEIRNYTQSGASQSVNLYLPPDASLAVGNTFKISRGCDYTMGANGCGKYSNQLNAQMDNHVPGQDARNINYTTWGS